MFIDILIMKRRLCRDDLRLTALSERLHGIGDPNRLRIICLLTQGTLCVCEIQKGLGLDQNLVSHHLRVLRDLGIVNFSKKAQWKHYSLNKDALQILFRDIREIFHT